jgi:hypothetical protein
MHASSLIVSLSLLAFVPACGSSKGEGEGETEGEGATESQSETEGERSVEEWIELCESQQGSNACDAVPPGMRGSETWRCEDLMIVRTSAPDCYASAVDSRCFAVSDSPNSGTGYIHTELVSMQTWLIEPSPDTTVYGSAVEACVLADDGVTWAPEPMCGCAGMVIDETGA